MTIIVKNPKTCDECGAIEAFGNCTNATCVRNQVPKKDES